MSTNSVSLVKEKDKRKHLLYTDKNSFKVVRKKEDKPSNCSLEKQKQGGDITNIKDLLLKNIGASSFRNINKCMNNSEAFKKLNKSAKTKSIIVSIKKKFDKKIVKIGRAHV